MKPPLRLRGPHMKFEIHLLIKGLALIRNWWRCSTDPNCEAWYPRGRVKSPGEGGGCGYHLPLNTFPPSPCFLSALRWRSVIPHQNGDHYEFCGRYFRNRRVLLCCEKRWWNWTNINKYQFQLQQQQQPNTHSIIIIPNQNSGLVPVNYEFGSRFIFKEINNQSTKSSCQNN